MLRAVGRFCPCLSGSLQVFQLPLTGQKYASEVKLKLEIVHRWV